MLTIIASTLMGIIMIVFIYMAVRIITIVGQINDLYHRLERHQRDVNELLRVNNPQAYYEHIKKEKK